MGLFPEQRTFNCSAFCEHVEKRLESRAVVFWRHQSLLPRTENSDRQLCMINSSLIKRVKTPEHLLQRHKCPLILCTSQINRLWVMKHLW